jgi:phosphoglucomutase/phosphomannomutase
VFDAIIARAKETGADLALATDPDCDRIGCAAPLTLAKDATWQTFTGNQIGALLADYVLEQWKKSGRLTAEHFVAITLVTSQLIRRIADSYGVRTIGDLLVGFKWIAGAIDENGPERFVFGAEESHGYLAGSYVRDKDGALASMLLCELAASLKANKQTLHEKLESLFWQHGLHVERMLNVQMPGSEGMARMLEVMAAFRTSPPKELAGVGIARIRDYEQLTITEAGAATRPFNGPQGDMVILDLASDGNYIACRPSGTEPKIKFYMFAYTPPEQLANLESARAELSQRLDAIEGDLRKFAGV